jgi:hypothetical protein
MQTTLRIDDTIYRQAKAEAAREGITLTRFIEEALRLRLERTGEAEGSSWPSTPSIKQPSAAEEGGAVPAALVERLQRLFAQADERDRLKEGSAGPFLREELYAERIDRFR